MASFPAGFPNPQSSGYSVTPVDQSVRTNMESGAARTRRRTFARNDQIDVSWQLTDAQMATFRTWFENGSTGAAGGAGWFTISLPIGATGITSCTAKFMDGYKFVYKDGFRWIVSGKLELQ